MRNETPPTDDEARESWERFRQFARALIRVDRRDVPKHEPVRRAKQSIKGKRDGVTGDS